MVTEVSVKPSAILQLVQRWPAEGNEHELVRLAKDASCRVHEFSAQQLVTLIHILAQQLYSQDGATGSTSGADPEESGMMVIPPRLLDEGAPRIAVAIANNRLTGQQIVQVVWAYALAGSSPRLLFDTAYRCLLGLPALDLPELSCTACADVDEEGRPVLDTEGQVWGGDDAQRGVEVVSVADLEHEDLYRLAWAFAAARTLDERHRAVHDVLLFDNLTETLRTRLGAIPTPTIAGLLAIVSSLPHYVPGVFEAAAAEILAREPQSHQQGQQQGQGEHQGQGQGSGREAADQGDTDGHTQHMDAPNDALVGREGEGIVVGALAVPLPASMAALSRPERGTGGDGASFSGRRPLTAAEALAVVRAYGRVQHRGSGATALLTRLMDRFLYDWGGGSELGSAELLDLAVAMRQTDTMHEPLLRAIACAADRTGRLGRLGAAGSGASGRARRSGPGGQWAPDQLLELARVIAAAQHTEREFHDAALHAILKSVHLSHLEQDLTELVDPCGSGTTPHGLKK